MMNINKKKKNTLKDLKIESKFVNANKKEKY